MLTLIKNILVIIALIVNLVLVVLFLNNAETHEQTYYNGVYDTCMFMTSGQEDICHDLWLHVIEVDGINDDNLPSQNLPWPPDGETPTPEPTPEPTKVPYEYKGA